MKYFIYIIFLLLFLPQITYGQSKPKRDTSKDKSVIEARRKKEQTQKNESDTSKNESVIETRHKKEQAQKRSAIITKQKKKQASQTKKNHQKMNSSPIAQTASYLKVSQSAASSKELEYRGGRVSFNVATDGKKWTINNLPYWCKVTKYSNWFILAYDANPKHDDRQDWFDVRSDNQQVRINISQQGTPLNIQVCFNYAYLLHNEYVSSLGQCLKITSNVTISGSAGQRCLIELFVVDEDGNNIKAKSGYSNYALPYSKSIYAASEIIPSTDKPETFTVLSYIPNNALNLLKKNNKLQCRLVVRCVKTNEYVSGATRTLKFKAKSKRGIVTTKYSK